MLASVSLVLMAAYTFRKTGAEADKEGNLAEPAKADISPLWDEAKAILREEIGDDGATRNPDPTRLDETITDLDV